MTLSAIFGEYPLRPNFLRDKEPEQGGVGSIMALTSSSLDHRTTQHNSRAEGRFGSAF